MWKILPTPSSSLHIHSTMSYGTVLSELFGFEHFRPGQLDVIQNVLDRDLDTVGILPTSTGKTLIFQLITAVKRRVDPAGITLVVSPLIALMQDQVRSCNALLAIDSAGCIVGGGGQKEVATMLGSAQNDPDADRDAMMGRYPLVYVSPEKLPFLPSKLLSRVFLLVVDECHCVSEHGNSFRPAYRKIRSYLPGVRTLALTATTTAAMEADIVDNLAMEQPVVVRTSMYRKNLHLSVRSKQTRDKDMEVIRSALPTEGRTVVFAPTRLDCERLARVLGSRARYYHAGLSPAERCDVMAEFVDGSILVATNCFGLGVDIPDIRFVVHYGLPRSILGYVQECGRAGRDGYNATCLLFEDASDIAKYTETERDVKSATAMFAWTRQTRCRHQSLLEMFGEAMTSSCCWGTTDHPGCDTCLGEIAESIVTTTTDDTLLLLTAMKETGNYSGRRLPVDFLLGSKSKKLTRFRNLHKSSVYAQGRHHSRETWIAIHRQLVDLKAIREVVTTRGYVVFKTTADVCPKMY
jgi:ATP-dependent DNA helicase RecQ